MASSSPPVRVVKSPGPHRQVPQSASSKTALLKGHSLTISRNMDYPREIFRRRIYRPECFIVDSDTSLLIHFVIDSYIMYSFIVTYIAFMYSYRHLYVHLHMHSRMHSGEHTCIHIYVHTCIHTAFIHLFISVIHSSVRII